MFLLIAVQINPCGGRKRQGRRAGLSNRAKTSEAVTIIANKLKESPVDGARRIVCRQSVGIFRQRVLIQYRSKITYPREYCPQYLD